MFDKADKLFQLVKAALISFKETVEQVNQVNFDSLGLALGVGLFLLVVILYKILWGENKFRHFYSGHEVPGEYDESTTWFRRLVCILPKFLLALSVIFMLIALANPYLPRTKITTFIDSLDVVYLVDVSTSKGWLFGNTGKSAGEITRQATLDMLKMRRGQNDRASLWLFSTNAFKAADFILDDDVFAMQVEDAPYVITGSDNDCLPENDQNDQYFDVVAPRIKVRIIDGEGGTNLVGGLKAVTGYFDQRGRKNKRKVLVIETDTAVDTDPAAEFTELKKRGIVPYAIFIKPNLKAEQRGCGGRLLEDPAEMSKLLKNKVKEYGGVVFDVQDRRGLDRAYAEINKLETTPMKITRQLLRVFIFQRPLMVAVVLAIFSLISGILVGLLIEEFP